MQPIIAELEPAAQAHFTEWVEQGLTAFYFDDYEATVKRFRLTELDEE